MDSIFTWIIIGLVAAVMVKGLLVDPTIRELQKPQKREDR
jgi:hypothetical protein